MWFFFYGGIMWSINRNNEIRMTRGDTPFFKIALMISGPDGSVENYVPLKGDSIIFALADKNGMVLSKEIPSENMILQLSESDTGNLEEGEYLYEISLNSDNYHCTFIPSTRFIIMREIYNVRTSEVMQEDRFIGTIPQICGALSQPGIPGLSAYEIAIKNGYVGSEKEWLQSLKAKDLNIKNAASVGEILCVKEIDQNGMPVEWETINKNTLLAVLG